jgi:hypothetical protein
MFKLLNKIESKRNSKKLFWKSMVLGKDIIWNVIDLPKKCRFLWRKFNWTEFTYKHPLLKRFFFRKVKKTVFQSCTPNSEVEIHSLLNHYDIYMYILAIKSFLRFYNNILVVVHGDGSLNNKDIELVHKHIKNIKIITKKEADRIIKDKLDKNTLKIRNSNVWGLKLFDVNLINKGKKTIHLDSDIIFLKKPTQIINWIKSNKTLPFYNLESNVSLFHMYQTNQKKLDKFINKTKHLKTSLKFNAGFIGYQNDITVQEIKTTIKELNNYYEEDQTIYALLFGRRNAKALNKKDYFVFEGNNFDSKAKMIHFINTFRFKKRVYLKTAKKIIKELK